MTEYSGRLFLSTKFTEHLRINTYLDLREAGWWKITLAKSDHELIEFKLNGRISEGSKVQLKKTN